MRKIDDEPYVELLALQELSKARFPDHFENHLKSTSNPVKKLFKSAAAKLISTVYIAIDNEDAGDNEDYTFM